MSRPESLARVAFFPSGRSVSVPLGTPLSEAAELASESLSTECSGRGACGQCMLQILEGSVQSHSLLHLQSDESQVLACQTRVEGPLRVHVLGSARLPRLASQESAVGLWPLQSWAPWPLSIDPLVEAPGGQELGVAFDLGTTTLRLLLVRLQDGLVVGESGRYNPQIRLGADCISRIIAAERGHLAELGSLVCGALAEMVDEAAQQAGVGLQNIRAYAVSGNATMIHLLLGEDPSGIRRVPSQPVSLAFDPVPAATLGLPGPPDTQVYTLPAAGGWVGGDIVAGVARAGLPEQESDGLVLYVDLGTNGEIALGQRDFAMACACSAGPAFEGGGIQHGMRADRGAVAGVTIFDQQLNLSVIGDGKVRGICGSGLIALADALFRAGWIDRSGRFTDSLPAQHRREGTHGVGVLLGEERGVVFWERDLVSLVRAKAAIFSGIRTLAANLGVETGEISRVIISGNFGRFLNLPAAVGIGLLPKLPPERYTYLGNGSLEGAALALLSRGFDSAAREYLQRITYVDLADAPGYMDEFVQASFLPHTDLGVFGRR